MAMSKNGGKKKGCPIAWQYLACILPWRFGHETRRLQWHQLKFQSHLVTSPFRVQALTFWLYLTAFLLPTLRQKDLLLVGISGLKAAAISNLMPLYFHILFRLT